MATNEYFRLKIGFFSSLKILKLKRRLGADGVLAWIQLLSFAADFKPDGDLSDLEVEEVAVVAGYQGDSVIFVETLLDIRLLDGSTDGSLSLHNWAEHNPCK